MHECQLFFFILEFVAIIGSIQLTKKMLYKIFRHISMVCVPVMFGRCCLKLWDEVHFENCQGDW